MEITKPKAKPKLIRPFTPGKKLTESLSKHIPNMKSQKILTKHKPSNSYSGSASIKTLSLPTKPSVSRPSSKPETARKSIEPKKKLISHRKSSSISDRSSSLIKSTIQAMHKRNSSQEFQKPSETSIISKVSYRSNTGLMPGNPNKVNQDAFIIVRTMVFSSSLIGVADGHGINGEHVSGYAKERYPSLLSQHPGFFSEPSTAITASALKLNKEVCERDFDTNFSGSTFITVLIRGKKLWCANIGDSRALLGREMQALDHASATDKCKGAVSRGSNHWMSIALSRDHKPNEADESARIESCGGRVEAYQDEHGNPFGPCRVWLKHQNIPGLAMSRALGDKVAGSVGVVAQPEILEFEVTRQDKFIVVGSDGIFEFLSNEDVVKIVVPYWRRGDCEGAAEALAKEARCAWLRVIHR